MVLGNVLSGAISNDMLYPVKKRDETFRTFGNTMLHIQGCPKTSASMRELASVLGMSSNNLADVSFDNPVLYGAPKAYSLPTMP